jgi:hypothetical protein
MADRVYRIERPDGTFRGAGPRGRGHTPKLFQSEADVSRHLKLGSGMLPRDGRSVEARLAASDATADEVVEYVLVEKRRVSTEDFLKERGS